MRSSVVVLMGLATAWASVPPRPVRADEPPLAEQIDRQINERLAQAGLRPAPPAEDAEFLRRVFLDLHGVVPSVEQTVRFLDSDDPAKRARLIDDLLASPRFGEYFGDVWRSRLLSPIEQSSRPKSDRFAQWLAARLNTGRWDETVADLLTATGMIDENPAATWLVEGRNPLGVTGLTDLSSRYFLGIRLNCAQCHDHPFAEWKQTDYWGMAAFFAPIQTPGRSKQVHMAGVQDNPRVTLATLQAADAIDGFRAVPATFLGGAVWKAESDEPARRALVRWLISPDNPYLARATVNRMWWHFFGRGFVEPVDDMHTGHAPSHPELLALLSRSFIDSGFDLKALCRAILNTRAYQQTSRADAAGLEAEPALFARMPVKVLSAEQLYDSLVLVLGPPSKTPAIDARLGTRYEFCQFFAGDGDPQPTRYDRGIPHLLRLMNSPQFAGRNVAALVSETTSAGRSTNAVLDALFLRILSRHATAADREWAQEHLRSTASPETAYRDLAWTLLMSSEFSLNH
jgi:hypothetical protein